ncbi:unnamed protein product [Linum trigynum]|uniref:Uncharacterized protein n=1 Tax=Linum trigynum TaxID=586398 RepID=A0AAV2CYK3_9ROSI
MTGSEVHDEDHGRNTSKGSKLRSGDKSSTSDPLATLVKHLFRMKAKVTDDVTMMEDLGTNFTQIQGDVQGMEARLMSLEINNEGLREGL